MLPTYQMKSKDLKLDMIDIKPLFFHYKPYDIEHLYNLDLLDKLIGGYLLWFVYLKTAGSQSAGFIEHLRYSWLGMEMEESVVQI